MVEIAIAGYGIVGSSVAEVLSNHTENIVRRVKEEIRIKYILDLEEFPEDPLANRSMKSSDNILNDSEVKIVAEIMGGLHPAREFAYNYLLMSKSVVTLNRELVTTKGVDPPVLAQKQNLDFLFKASVGGGIPIIRLMSQCPAANDMIEVNGILNGTTDLVLTKMTRNQMDFDNALALTQKLGYAEHNPVAGVEGMNTCCKIYILAPLVFGKRVYPDRVHAEGTTKVTLVDVEYTEVWDGTIKLIGRVKILENDQIHITVCLMFVPRGSQLTTVDGMFNSIQVHGDSIGDVAFYGKDAGKLPIANAVVADVIGCAWHFKARKYLFWDRVVPDYVRDYREDTITFYIRARSEDSAFALDQAEDLFGPVRQLMRKGADKNEFAFITEPLAEEDLLEKPEQLREGDVKVLSTLRVNEF